VYVISRNEATPALPALSTAEGSEAEGKNLRLARRLYSQGGILRFLRSLRMTL